MYIRQRYSTVKYHFNKPERTSKLVSKICDSQYKNNKENSSRNSKFNIYTAKFLLCECFVERNLTVHLWNSICGVNVVAIFSFSSCFSPSYLIFHFFFLFYLGFFLPDASLLSPFKSYPHISTLRRQIAQHLWFVRQLVTFVFCDK